MAAETEFEMVTRHVANGERHILSQLGLIARLDAAGLDTAAAENLLATLERSQAMHRDHLARLEKPNWAATPVTDPMTRQTPSGALECWRFLHELEASVGSWPMGLQGPDHAHAQPRLPDRAEHHAPEGHG